MPAIGGMKIEPAAETPSSSSGGGGGGDSGSGDGGAANLDGIPPLRRMAMEAEMKANEETSYGRHGGGGGGGGNYRDRGFYNGGRDNYRNNNNGGYGRDNGYNRGGGGGGYRDNDYGKGYGGGGGGGGYRDNYRGNDYDDDYGDAHRGERESYYPSAQQQREMAYGGYEQAPPPPQISQPIYGGLPKHIGAGVVYNMNQNAPEMVRERVGGYLASPNPEPSSDTYDAHGYPQQDQEQDQQLQQQQQQQQYQQRQYQQQQEPYGGGGEFLLGSGAAREFDLFQEGGDSQNGAYESRQQDDDPLKYGAPPGYGGSSGMVPGGSTSRGFQAQAFSHNDSNLDAISSLNFNAASFEPGRYR